MAEIPFTKPYLTQNALTNVQDPFAPTLSPLNFTSDSQWFNDAWNTGSPGDLTQQQQDLGWQDHSRYWSPEQVRQDLYGDQLLNNWTSNPLARPSDDQIMQEWIRRNTHASRYQNDPEYRREWDSTHGDLWETGGEINPWKAAFNVFTLANLGGGFGEELSSLGGGTTETAAGSGAPVGGMAGSTAINQLEPFGGSGDTVTTPTSFSGGTNPLTNAGDGMSSDLLNNLLIGGSSLLSGYLSNEATDRAMDEIARQYDLNRADTAPWREAGVNALNQLQGDIDQTSPMYGEFTAPEGSELPEAFKGDRFQFNLEDDPIYQFQKTEAAKEVERALASRGYNQSGKLFDDLSKRIVGHAGTYQDDAFRRQLAGSRENYGRGLTEYGLGTDRANALYGRGVGEWGMGRTRNQDIYGRQQDRLNRLAALSGTGQTAATNLGQQGMGAANQLANLNLQQGAGWNNAVQGGIGNYLSNRQNNQWMDLYNRMWS